MTFKMLNSSLLKDCITTDVRAMGLYSFNTVIEGLLWTGRMVETLKQDGTSDSSRYQLKIRVMMGTSCLAQILRQQWDIMSDPGAFPIFCL